MKKIISLFLIAVMALVPMATVSAAETGILDTMIEKIAAFTPEKRSTLISYFRPFVTTDAGVDAALANLESGVMDTMLQDIMGEDVDKEFIRRFFRSMTCIKEETLIRMTYADIYQNKIALSGVSAATTAGIQKMMNAYYVKSPGVKKIFNEDGVTVAVFANMLTALPKINGNQPPIAYQGGAFSINTMDQVFQASFDAIWAGYVSRDGKRISYSMILGELVAFLNGKLATSDHSSVATALGKLGICKVDTTTPQGPGGGPSAEKPTEEKPTEEKPQIAETADYTVLASYPGVTADMLGGNFVIIKTKAEAASVITIKDAGENAVIREFNNGGTILMKDSYPTGKDLVAHVKPNTVYLVKAGDYPFVDANGWGKSYISALYNRGIINGKSQDTFAPDANITRAEFVKLITTIFDVKSGAEASFADVAKTAWYYPYVADAYQNGYISGIGENQFGPEMNIKRQDMAKMINTVLESKGIYGTKAESKVLSDFDTISDYAKEHVLAMCGMGIISGDENKAFHPTAFATRQEAAKMIFGMLAAYVDSRKEQ